MAKLIRMENELADKHQVFEAKIKKEKSCRKLKKYALILSPILFFVIALLRTVILRVINVIFKSNLNTRADMLTYFIVYVTCILVLLINYVYTRNNLKKLKSGLGIYNSGLSGELKTVQFLTRLSNDYTIINNVKLTIKGYTSELDNLIIGSNGIFVVETKNHAGLISGDVSDNNWKQEKSRGKNYSVKEMYNPIMQVTTHGKKVEDLLKNIGIINVKPKTIVCFINPGTSVSVTGSSTTEVYDYANLDNMLKNIEEHNLTSGVIFSEDDKNKIIDAVSKNVKDNH